MAVLTPNLHLIKPTVNGEETENTWGYDVNANFDILDAANAVQDGDHGDIVVSGQGANWTFDPTVVSAAGRGVIAVDAQAGLLEQNGATAFRKRGITVANQPPVGGVDGDLWLQYNLALPPEVNWDVTTFYFNTRTEAAASDIPGPIKVVHSGGFAVAGDNGQSVYKRLNGPPVNPTNPGFFRSVDRYKADGGQDPTLGGYWALVPDSPGILRVEQFGAKGDYWLTDPSYTLVSTVNPSPTDNLGPIRAAEEFAYYYINTISAGTVGAPLPPFPNFADGPALHFGVGSYYTSDTLRFTRTVSLLGAGMGFFHSGAQTRIYVAAGKSAVHLACPTSSIPGNSNSYIRGIYFESLGKAGQTDKHGIVVRNTCVIQYCAVNGFGGDGVNIASDVTAGSNSNLFHLDKCSLYNNTGHGIHCQGGDANAGGGMFLSVMFNGGYGIHDISFLGNTWVGAHAAGNIGGSFLATDPNARTVFIGCYSEGDQPPARIDRPSICIGGLSAAGTEGSGWRVFNDTMTSHTLVYSGTGSRVTIQNAAPANNIKSIFIDNNPNGSNWVCDPANGLIGWYNGDPGARTTEWAYAITTEQRLATYGRAEALEPATMIFPKGIFIGGDSNDSTRKMWVNDKFNWQFLAGPGHQRRPGAYRNGDIAWLFGDDTAGECCTQDGTATPEIWTSGTIYDTGNTGVTGGVYVKNSAGRFYRCTVSPGTPSVAEPLHTSGVVAQGDGYSWRWLSNQPAIFKRFGSFLGAKSTTVNDPIHNLTQAWSNVAVAFSGYLIHITDTASHVDSVIQEWAVNGVRKAAVRKDGVFLSNGVPVVEMSQIDELRAMIAALQDRVAALEGA